MKDSSLLLSWGRVDNFSSYYAQKQLLPLLIKHKFQEKQPQGASQEWWPFEG